MSSTNGAEVAAAAVSLTNSLAARSSTGSVMANTCLAHGCETVSSLDRMVITPRRASMAFSGVIVRHFSDTRRCWMGWSKEPISMRQASPNRSSMTLLLRCWSIKQLTSGKRVHWNSLAQRSGSGLGPKHMSSMRHSISSLSASMERYVAECQMEKAVERSKER